MAFEWSPSQKKAIFDDGQNILVSAGAGSGKTAVLTQRVFELVKKGHPISRFLVLTFTNAAAAEMKSRVRDKLLNDPACQHMAAELENAHIETFDAFALFLVKKYALLLGISPDVAILDQSILNVRKNRLRDEVLEEYYAKSDPNFLDLIQTYCLKKDDNLKNYLNRLMNFADLQIDKSDFYAHGVDKFYRQSVIEGFIEEYHQGMISTLQHIDDTASEFGDSLDANNICDFIQTFSSFGSYDSLLAAIKESKFPAKSKTALEEDAPLRQAIANDFKKIKNSDFGTREEIISGFLSTQKYASLLLEIARTIDERFMAFKKEHNSYSFSDIAKMALQVLSNPVARDEMKASFDYILVDEYQDTSDIQERVINYLDNNNVYMVGDVKQSIYRFRNANCQIFQDKYQRYKTNDGGEEIDLNQSFRSRKEIVDFVNETFSLLMKPRFNMIDYSSGHAFIYQPDVYHDLLDAKEDYQPVVYTYPGDKSDKNVEREISIIADDIIDKYNKHYQVYDKEEKLMRDARFSDFAIIIDRGGEFDKYHRYFSAHNIPLKVINDEEINNSDLGYVTKNLLKLFRDTEKEDYGEEYKHAFMSIARSFLVQCPDEEIYRIVKNSLYLSSDIAQKVKEVVTKYASSSLYEILHSLYDAFDIYQKIICLDHIKNSANNLEMFLSFARSMDELGSSLDDFVQYFDDLKNYQLDVKFPCVSDNIDAVTLINIHKSKGLEYPFVYLAGLFKKFNREESKQSFLISSTYGLSLPIYHQFGHDSLVSYLIKERMKQDDFEEKLRLLYVATTRVRERLIILSPTFEKESMVVDPTSVLSFSALLSFASLNQRYGVEYTFKNSQLPVKTAQKCHKKIEIRQIEVPSLLVDKHRASKENEGETNSSLLQFGNQLHHLLEIVDYESKDTSFIANPQLRRYVDNVLHSSLFSHVKNADLRHEFAFWDDKNHLQGIIDCLILTPTAIKIVDFKLKNIDDKNYINQLLAYRAYLEQITSLPIQLYLLSAITGEEKEIE